ncbi:unnamed protein product [Allacma fusca]|uniref:Uncharacterized protein n=1 Tax=Allacma fusca TaxID=39272 RepID=A0A8J2K8H7_9HEXA|nr:unnamed protein product [Allacma fusca]
MHPQLSMTKEIRKKVKPKRRRIGPKTKPPMDECQEASKFLMDHGHNLLLLNIVFGLLPVSLVHGRITYVMVSLNMLYSWIFTIAIALLSYVFFLAINQNFLDERPGAQAKDMAISLVRTIHIFGFLSLTIRGKSIARKVPVLWNDLAMAFQKSVINFHALEFKEIKKLKKFCTVCVLFYILVLVMNATQVFFREGSEAKEGLCMYFNMTIQNDFENYAFHVAYLLWDSTTLSHVLVCMLLLYFNFNLCVCLKSLNGQLLMLLNLLATKNEGRVEKPKAFCAGDEIPSIAFRVEDPIYLRSEDIEEKLSYLKECYCSVEKVSQGISKLFGFSLVIEALILVGNAVSSGYFLIVNSLNPNDKDTWDSVNRISAPVLDIFTHVNFFYWLAVSATRLQIEVSLNFFLSYIVII